MVTCSVAVGPAEGALTLLEPGLKFSLFNHCDVRHQMFPSCISNYVFFSVVQWRVMQHVFKMYL